MHNPVSHTTVEEQFDHHVGLPAGLNTNTTNKNFQIYVFSDLTQVEKASIRGWAELSWTISSLVSGITCDDRDVDLMKLRMSKDIDSIAEILASTYGDYVAAEFGTLLNTTMLSLLSVITGITASNDTTTLVLKLNDDTVAFADFLNSINSDWSADTVTDIFTRMENLYMYQAQYCIKQEWASSIAAANKAHTLMFAKQEKVDPSFAEIFSTGVINSNLINNIY